MLVLYLKATNNNSLQLRFIRMKIRVAKESRTKHISLLNTRAVIFFGVCS